MTKKVDQEMCCEAPDVKLGCCNIESVVTIDSKGQLLLPKEVRERINLKAGDKLVVVSMANNQDTCCVMLIKADYFGGMVKNFLEPMMDDILKK